MKLGRMLLLGAALAMGSTTAAQAGIKIMATPPIVAGAPATQTLYCDITNLNKTEKVVTIEIMDLAGAVLNFPFPYNLAPGTGAADGSIDPTAAWCRFTVDGSTKKYRGIAIYDNNTDYTVSVPAK